MRLDGARTLLTGAGSGIGRELAVRLAREGACLVLVGRRSRPLAETADHVADAGGTAHVVPGDVTSPELPERLVAETVARLGGLDLLVNNAGNICAGRLDETAAEDVRAMVELNLLAPVLLTRAALPRLRENAGPAGEEPRAGVVSIAAGMALVGLHYYAVYSAAKAGLARFGEALRRELVGSGIHVTTAYPGATATPMMASSAAGPELGFDRRPAAEVAERIVTGLLAGEAEINTAPAGRRRLQALNAQDPLAVDALLAQHHDALAAAARGHRSM